jgi:hypothetical protein
MTTKKTTKSRAELPTFHAADGQTIKPSEYRLVIGGKAAVEEVNVPVPEAIVEGRFKARSSGFGFDKLKRKGRPGWVLEAHLDLEELVVESVTVPEPDPSLFDGEDDPEDDE